MKLALGTAQFGMDYGVTNQYGRVTEAHSLEILRLAENSGMRLIDTAAAYGSSERALGSALCAQPHEFLINTKISGEDAQSAKGVDCVEESLRKLNANHIYSLMLHSVERITDDQWCTLEQAKATGMVQKIGASVYDPEHALALLETRALDVIQLPFNLFDQRFLSAGLLLVLKQKGIEIHARSLFLQGSLLQDIDQLPAYFHRFAPWFARISDQCHGLNLTPLELAISLVHQIKDIDYVVLGIAHPQQLQQIIDAYEKTREIQFDYSALACNEQALIDPSTWPS